MAFKRVIQVDITTQTGSAFRISALDLSFNIERNTDVQNNTASFTIYNVKDDTIRNILTSGNGIIVRAGYEDENNLGIIFSGIISGINAKWEGVDRIVELEATDIGTDLNNILKTKISLSYKANAQLATVINDLSGIMSVPITGIQNISGIVLNNGFVYAGSIRGAIKKIQNIAYVNDVGVYFDLGEFVLYRLYSQDSTFGIVRVTESSGLIGNIEDITDDKEKDPRARVAFSSLMNPKIKPNTVINIATEKKNGTYIVEKCTFQGGTRSDEFYVRVECVE